MTILPGENGDNGIRFGFFNLDLSTVGNNWFGSIFSSAIEMDSMDKQRPWFLIEVLKKYS